MMPASNISAHKDSKKDFFFGTKAETLNLLRGRLDWVIIPESLYFAVGSWAEKRELHLTAIREKFKGKSLAIRSSSISEDGQQESLAGKYLTILDVQDRGSELEEAIDSVVKSMTGNPKDQVLVQLMYKSVALSGVILTYDSVFKSPYYCIEYEDESGLTDRVTAGRGIYKTINIYRDTELSAVRSPRILLFLKLAKDLEAICGSNELDIEFALSSNGEMVLFQVRRIAHQGSSTLSKMLTVDRKIKSAADYVTELSKPKDGIYGERTILAVMSDWNPAEIIGVNPRHLSSSLYMELITKKVWREARAKMGYRNLSSGELMVLLNNHPYVDVRNSFNSFLPEGIPDFMGEKLVNAWLDRLKKFPEYHDKVEFEIVPTCIDFCFDENFISRYPSLLSTQEFKIFRDSLSTLTRSFVIQDSENSLVWAINCIQLLNSKIKVLSHPKSGDHSWLVRAQFLLDLCRELGSLPFAIAARHAFVAESLLHSAVNRGLFSETRAENFRRGIETVTGRMVRAYENACKNISFRDSFLLEYGHLRPGTYEITSFRYDEREDLFDAELDKIERQEYQAFSLSSSECKNLKLLLNEVGLGIVSPEEFLEYIKRSIAAREEIKFQFTRVLSDALNAIIKWGGYHGLSRENLSFISWESFSRLLISSNENSNLGELFLKLAHSNKIDYESSQAFKASHIIFNPNCLYVATQNRSIPNFVGSSKVKGKIIKITASTSAKIYLKGSIVCIENADPGYDWIFMKQPAAIVTKFGGRNSHMSIRCSELGIPAVIGCGDQIFNLMVSSNAAEIDCSQKFIRPIVGSFNG